ncbi:MAG: phosphoribosylformylglycinamidine synthase subunit PurS [Elusimicrobiota bacterium]|jgi:phosphoribosylformylglycinamidine (FGAM) synthase PurS component|nr:phosphoribosylformylglycinamidine synthase subunit PurS [Elusimicrobiota bacterium]
MRGFIEVFHKKNYGDKKTLAIKTRLQAAGLKNIKEVIPSVIYQIDGDFTAAQIDKIGAQLLADPVLETYKTKAREPKGFFKVQVWIKDSSTDVVGQSVKDIIGLLGHGPAQNVRVGNAFAISGNFTKAQLEAAVKKTFVNEMLNKYTAQEF